jgi:alanine dehydrogenase
MKFGIPAETRSRQIRIAAMPEIIKKPAACCHHILIVQPGAGARSRDKHYVAGALI